MGRMRTRTYTIAEAARVLEVDESTLAREAKRCLAARAARLNPKASTCVKIRPDLGRSRPEPPAQELPCLQMGDRIVFSAQAIDDWIATGSFSGEVDVRRIIREEIGRLAAAMLGAISETDGANMPRNRLAG